VGAQGDSDVSVLTPFGEEQAARTATALSRMPFDRCAHMQPSWRPSCVAQAPWACASHDRVPQDRGADCCRWHSIATTVSVEKWREDWQVQYLAGPYAYLCICPYGDAPPRCRCMIGKGRL
jgi:hypothetical protein